MNEIRQDYTHLTQEEYDQLLRDRYNQVRIAMKEAAKERELAENAKWLKAMAADGRLSLSARLK